MLSFDIITYHKTAAAAEAFGKMLVGSDDAWTFRVESALRGFFVVLVDEDGLDIGTM